MTIFHFFLIWLTWRFTHLLVIKSLLHPITTHDSLYTIMHIYIILWQLQFYDPMIYYIIYHDILWQFLPHFYPCLSQHSPAHQARFLGLPTVVYAASCETESELSVAQRGGWATRPGFLCRRSSCFGFFPHEICTLWWTNIAMENGYRNSGFSQLLNGDFPLLC